MELAKIIVGEVWVDGVFVHEQRELVTVWDACCFKCVSNNYFRFRTHVFVVFCVKWRCIVGEFFVTVFYFEPGGCVLFVGESERGNKLLAGRL